MTRAIAAIAALTSSAVTSLVPAADIFVPADFHTIQAAIDAAAIGDHVVVADGTYAGAGNTNLDYRSKQLTVRSLHGPENCIIDGDSVPGVHAFTFDADPVPFGGVEGFTIRNFVTTAGDEGALRIVNGGPRVENCVFKSCATGVPGSETPAGSAIWIGDASPIVQSCRFADNVGSAVFIGEGSVVYLIESTFERNTTWSDDGGGAISSDGYPLTFSSFYRDNRAIALSGKGRGGAIAQRGLFLDLTGITFEGNSAQGPDGGSGMAVHTRSGLVMNGNVVRNHDDAGSGAALLIDATDAQSAVSGHISGIFEDNTMGAIQIIDPNGQSSVQVGGTQFCRNGPFHVAGDFVDFGSNHVCCPGDIDASGAVDLADLISVLAAWGACDGCAQDLNGDGAVGLSDLLTVLAGWGGCPEL